MSSGGTIQRRAGASVICGLLLFLWATPAAAQISFDAAAALGNNGGSTTPWTSATTLTVGSCANRMAIVGVLSINTNDVTAVAIGGSPATEIGSAFDVTFSSTQYLSVWYLMSPSTGSNAVQITAGSAHYLVAAAASYCGVYQTDQPDASHTENFGSANTINAVSVGVANAWVIMPVGGTYSGGNPMSAGSGTVERVVESFEQVGIYDSGGPVSIGTTTLTASETGSTMGSRAISFKPDTFSGGGGGAGGSSYRLLMGCCGPHP